MWKRGAPEGLLLRDVLGRAHKGILQPERYAKHAILDRSTSASI